jgi:hypothetical protein
VHEHIRADVEWHTVRISEYELYEIQIAQTKQGLLKFPNPELVK